MMLKIKSLFFMYLLPSVKLIKTFRFNYSFITLEHMLFNKEYLAKCVGQT